MSLTLSLSSLRASGSPVAAVASPPSCAMRRIARMCLCMPSRGVHARHCIMRASALLSTHVFGWRSRPLETVEKTEYGYFLISYASPQGPLTPLEAFFGGITMVCSAGTFLGALAPSPY